MEFLLDPGIWVSLLTLIILEIVLGIDNLVFIAILAENFPLSNAIKLVSLVCRCTFNAFGDFVVYHHLLVTLTRPLITVLD